MTILIIIAVVIFLWWSLVPPAQPRQKNLNDLINESEKRQGNYCNVYKTKLAGKDFYYTEKSPDKPNDIRVFTGTENECIHYSNRFNN